VAPTSIFEAYERVDVPGPVPELLQKLVEVERRLTHHEARRDHAAVFVLVQLLVIARQHEEGDQTLLVRDLQFQVQSLIVSFGEILAHHCGVKIDQGGGG
jgi:hypothetical protein